MKYNNLHIYIYVYIKILSNNYNPTVTPWKAQSYGPTNSYKWNEKTPATRVIYKMK